MERNIKKLFVLASVVVTVMLCCAFSAGALDATGKCGENVFWEYDSSTKELVISGKGAMYDYYIDDMYYYDVNRDSESPFCDSDIVSLVIEDGVTTIGAWAFDDCVSLTDVTISDSVTSIGNVAFDQCKSLKEIKFSDGLKQIGEMAFNNCSGIESLTIPDSVTIIGRGAFGCGKLKSITLPFVGGMRTQDRFLAYIFGGLTYKAYRCVPVSLEEVILSDECTEVPAWSFYECKQLKSITFGKGVTSIGYGAFYGCEGLSNVTIKGNIKTVSGDAFFDCRGLENIYVKDVYSWLGINFESVDACPRYYNLYCGNKLLENLTIPEGITAIKPYAFYGADCLKSVIIPDEVKSIGEYAFSLCRYLEDVTIGYGINTISKYAFKDSGLGIVRIPVSVTKIEEEAFNVSPGPVSKQIYYSGTQKQWNAIDIGDYNFYLETTPIKYNVLQSVTGKPSKITAIQNSSAVKLTWSAVKGANIYRVYQKNGSTWKALGNVARLDGTIKNLKAGTKYTFAVKAGVKSGSNVAWSNAYTTIDTSTQAVKPAKVVAAQNTSAIKLTWTKCPGATGYRIYYKSGNTWKVAVSTTSATSHTFSGLKAGAKYTFAVRPYIKNGNTVVWSDYTQFMTATKPATVTAKTSSPAKGKISLSWNAVNGADGYQVYYKLGNGSYKLYKTVGAGTRSMSFKNLKSGTKYTFAVRAGIKTSGGNIFGGYKTGTVTVK